MTWLRHVFVGQFEAIPRREWPKVLLLSAFFFLVIATFWVLKPLKRGVLINYFGDDPLRFFGLTLTGAESEQIGKILNLVVIGFLMVLFTWLVRRYPRHHLVLIFACLFSGIFAALAAVIETPNEAVVWSFFVLGDVFNSAFVALFWAFTNDIVSPEESKRIYGVVGLGGVVGGFVGATVVESSVQNVGRAPLLLSCIVPMALVALIAFLVERRVERENGGDGGEPAASSTRTALALEGAKLVFRSRYLVAIVAIIACYELVSNVIDFQLASTVERSIEASLEKDAFFGRVGQLIGIVSIVVQLFGTSFVLQRFGIGVALAALPAAIALSSSGYLLFPTLTFAALMSTSDNGLNYSIQQSAKEALYVPTSKDVTYKAKAFIDMFVQRLAKVLSVAVNLAFVSVAALAPRWLSFLTLGFLGVWTLQIRVAARRYERRVEDLSEGSPVAGGEAEPRRATT